MSQNAATDFDVRVAVEAQATAVSGIIMGQSNTVLAGNILRVLNKRVRANKRRLSR
jgi:hypothetical protein